MLEGHSLVYYAPGKWEGLWRNRHQLMSLFAKRNKVLFIERRPHLRPTLAHFRRGDLSLLDLARPLVRHISDGLYVFSFPLWAPVSGRSPLREVTQAVRQRALRGALRRLGMTHPLVWYSFPTMVDQLAEISDARLRIYHVVDEYTSYHRQSDDIRRRIAAQEKEMLAAADVVIVVSEALYQAKSPLNPHTYLVPNAVNYEAYTAALKDPQLPLDLLAIQPPRLGYIGLVGDRLDLEVLRRTAAEHPEWSLVLLGTVRIEEQIETWQALQGMSNVHHLGPVDAAEVPQYVKGFQVGLMPYVLDRHAEHISPLKLYDYLAAGLPVASVDIPAARAFGSHIQVARSPADFGRAIQDALADTAPERWQSRRQVAAQHTWEARVEQLSDILERHLANAGGAFDHNVGVARAQEGVEGR